MSAREGERADTICVRLPRSTCLALKSETAESAIATTRKTILKGNDECRTKLKGSKLWAAGVTGRHGAERDVCLARAAVFRDLTPFASAVQTHNHIWTKQKLPPPPPLSTPHTTRLRHGIMHPRLRSRAPGGYKVHLLVFSRLTLQPPLQTRNEARREDGGVEPL